MAVFRIPRICLALRNATRIMGGIVVLAFVSGSLPDIDHPIASILGISNGRFLHLYFARIGNYFTYIGLIVAIACFCRFIWIRFLTKR